MALAFKEVRGSRRFSNAVITGATKLRQDFHVTGTEDCKVAADFVRLSLPPYYAGTNMRLANIDGDLAEAGTKTVVVTAEYEHQPNSPVGDGGLPESSFAFDSSAQSFHADFARAQWVNAYGAGNLAANNLIGKNIEGTEVLQANFTFEETHYWDGISAAYLTTLYRLTTTVNAYPWKIWPARSLLFLGAVGSESDNGQFRVIYRFVYRPPIPLYNAASNLYGYAYGWDYVWNETREVLHGVIPNQRRYRVQGDNMIAQVYEETDLALLGIGI